MNKYIVRINCEYSKVVEAENEEDALDIASDEPVRHWPDITWSDYEVEPYE